MQKINSNLKRPLIALVDSVNWRNHTSLDSLRKIKLKFPLQARIADESSLLMANLLCMCKMTKTNFDLTANLHPIPTGCHARYINRKKT